MSADSIVQDFMAGLAAIHPQQPEFLQAVHEVVSSVAPILPSRPDFQKANLLERMTEPDRVIIFRVVWEDDKGDVRVNRGYRVQFNNAIGPYKGGIRFHPSVNLSVLKFLGFEQVFKNSLTTLPMGGGKGGSDFDPAGKSDREVMRFCQAFMSELYRHLGPDTDVPAGDIGVGAREVGFMYGYYKKLRNEFTGVFTGKGLPFGGSLIRPEATGYGCVYFMQEMLRAKGTDLTGRTALVSGSGNVAQYTVEKLLQLGAKVLTMSDSSGFVHAPSGITPEQLEWIKDLKNRQRGRIEDAAREFGWTFSAGQRPWAVAGELAFPCATQNELSGDDAKELIKNGTFAVAEGANMPSTPEAISAFRSTGIAFGPGKAANAGGVSVSGLEMSQNSLRLSWTREEVDDRLQHIMTSIHETCQHHGMRADGSIDYVDGANIGGFLKVAEAILAQGLV